MRRGHVEPGGEPGEARAALFHVSDRTGGHQLCALHPEEIGEVEEKEANPVRLGEAFEFSGHGIL